MTFVRNHVLSLTTVLLLGGLANAQDPLEQARQQRVLQAQKLKADLNANFREAERLERLNPSQARDLLRKNRTLLDEDSITLMDADRKAFLQEITIRLYKIDNAANVEKKAQADAATAQRQIDAFKEKLRKDNAKITDKPGPSVPILTAQLDYKEQQMQFVRQQQELARRMAAQQNPNPQQPPGFVPKPNTPESTIPAKDILLMRALNSTTKFAVKLQPMREVLDLLEEKTAGNMTIIIDSQGFKENLTDEPVFLNDPVTKDFSKQPMKIRTILKMILGERPPGFGYYIEDGILYIAPTTKVNKKVIPKSYPVSLLVDPDGLGLVQKTIVELQNAKPGPKGEILFGPNGQILNQNIDGLIGRLKSIEPEHWKNADGSGGPGTMSFVPAGSNMQITCSLEVHYLLMASRLLENKR